MLHNFFYKSFAVYTNVQQHNFVLNKNTFITEENEKKKLEIKCQNIPSGYHIFRVF